MARRDERAGEGGVPARANLVARRRVKRVYQRYVQWPFRKEGLGS